jgi:predicted short-subunit dehydrogenase-like oxidoreductase (DUF2520 family)
MPKERFFTSVSIVGPGRLGQALAIALDQAGYRIDALVARDITKATRTAASLKLHYKPSQTLGIDQLSNLKPTDLILITTPDDAIETVVRKIAKLKSGSEKRLILHTSGALSSEVLRPLAKLGFHIGSLHPLVSVSDPVAGARALRGAFFCVEGDAVAAAATRKLVRVLGGKAFKIAPQSKPLYHAAALTSAGHLTALVDLAMEMLVSCGLKRTEAQKVLMPLVESAVNNLKVSPPEAALTGTFARGDIATVRRHLNALSEDGDSDAMEIYRLLGLRSLQLASKKGIDRKVLQRIRKMLLS